MKQIHFLSNTDPIPTYALSPVRCNFRLLKERGYNIRIFTKPSPQCLECDILCCVSKPTQRIVDSKEVRFSETGSVIKLLKRAGETADKIIWMDDSDSTSVTHFELLPYIDLYLKKQLYVDRSQYRREMYGGRLISDFYHRVFDVDDSKLFAQFYPLPENQQDKVRLSWNIGMGDIINAFGSRSYLQRYFPKFFPANYEPKLTNFKKNRPIDVFLRTSVNLGRETLAFHRAEMLARLKFFFETTCWSGMAGDAIYSRSVNAKRRLPTKPGHIKKKQFVSIMRNTKIMPSPFGWGELGARDYEAFLHGAALLKPSMDHMETWPNIFLPHETYEPIRWDFEDFHQILMELLSDESRRLKVARAGQEAYWETISPEGMVRFCDHFIKQIDD